MCLCGDWNDVCNNMFKVRMWIFDEKKTLKFRLSIISKCLYLIAEIYFSESISRSACIGPVTFLAEPFIIPINQISTERPQIPFTQNSHTNIYL